MPRDRAERRVSIRSPLIYVVAARAAARKGADRGVRGSESCGTGRARQVVRGRRGGQGWPPSGRGERRDSSGAGASGASSAVPRGRGRGGRGRTVLGTGST